jgi:hypothetical protein
MALCSITHAQTGGDNGDTITPPVAGIEIDADGVLRVRQIDYQSLATERARALQASGQDLTAMQSPLRKVSLNRLESAVSKLLSDGKSVTREMQALAGLTRIEYVFFYPESGDIVIAGPAEKCVVDKTGRFVGVVSNRPAVRLDDLVVAMRAFSPDMKKSKTIGCSIDPTQEGLKKMAQVLASFGGDIGNSSAAMIANTLKNNLGFQTVTVHGVPDDTHFAQVLVEADYRMKLIGIGLEQFGIPIKSWAERANPNGSSNSLQRWFFTANYASVKVSPDQLAMQLQGQGVQLVGENELVSRDGQRQVSGKVDRASKGFTDEFTAKFNDLAEVSPVFFEMRNLFDMTVAAAFIQERQWYQLSGWDLGVFASDDTFPVQKQASPKQVESAVNAIWKGGRLMTPIGGGVQIKARDLISSEAVLEDANLGNTKTAAGATMQLDASQWWWD